MSEELTQARLKELLHYDPDTGVFTWRVASRKGPNHFGQRAGTVHRGSGYRVIRVEGKLMRGARLAVLYMTGRAPTHAVDHINGVTDDDRWGNLRQATQSENMHNRVATPGYSGLPGVHLHKPSGLWVAGITLQSIYYHLGYFRFAEDAHRAYLVAKARLHPFQPVPREASCVTSC